VDFRKRIEAWRNKLSSDLSEMKSDHYGFSSQSEVDYREGKESQLESVIDELDKILKTKPPTKARS